jgi:hypothetical protein
VQSARVLSARAVFAHRANRRFSLLDISIAPFLICPLLLAGYQSCSARQISRRDIHRIDQVFLFNLTTVTAISKGTAHVDLEASECSLS